MNDTSNNPRPSNFIRQIIDADLASGKNGSRVATRFPPEPNGYLHIGHAKSIVLNFGIAQDYHGTCNLRFDDTNPAKEDIEYVESIKQDVQWLGFKWTHLYYASDYFDKLYDFALQLIKLGKAYVCDLSFEQMREYRGTLTQPGKDSPYRNRSVAENLGLFDRMRKGEFPDGSRVLRAKIDMASPNINLRDPTIYRIKKDAEHHQTGSKWCIYPMYDYAHCLSDMLEGITHSLCTLEFEDHRPLYDWVLDVLKAPCHPQQIEFSRLNLEYTVMSKRKLTELVQKKLVDGWNDPRMPTIAGLRRRGFTPESIRDFCLRIGVTKADNIVEMSLLEDCIRNDLNERAIRRMAVLHPLKVLITNYPYDKVERLTAANHPQKAEFGNREIAFCAEIFIDRNDFMESPPKGFKRLIPGGEVRLRYGYVIRCDEVIKDAGGTVQELHCSYDAATLGTNPVGRKVAGVIHWVSARHAIRAKLRLYDRLFIVPNPDVQGSRENKDYTAYLNPDSLHINSVAVLEPALANAKPQDRFQFEREGYFCLDEQSPDGAPLVFNRTVTLRDTWAKSDK
ncbi:MAG: glutamine--tRNA ligase/YqeY domain fusion protein [Gammaproteobacteria bacterium]|nr:glutamine--tRNA ligase/YqeY domain fusion protein [Gammaproteobacteria bacterium]